MKKPKKPTRNNKPEYLTSGLLTGWGGESVRDVLAKLCGILEKNPNAEFLTEWNYTYSDIYIVDDSEDNYEERLEKYREDMLEWKKFRANQLLEEVERG